MTPEDIATLKETPEYRHIVSRLTKEIVSPSDIEDYFNKWVDPDVINLFDIEISSGVKDPTWSDGFIIGVLLGLMLAEHRTGEPSVAAK